MKCKKPLFIVAMIFITVLFLGTIGVEATEYEESLIKKIAPDGNNATIKMLVDSDYDHQSVELGNALNRILDEDGYGLYLTSLNDDYSKGTVLIYKDSEEENAFSKEYEINLKYEEPKVKSTEKETVDAVVTKIEEFTKNQNPFEITDLSLINYYMTNAKFELYNLKALSKAIKFSKELVDLSKGADLEFYIPRSDLGGGNDFEDFGYGIMSVYYKGYHWTAVGGGAQLKNIIYISENTEETTDAYVAAAQKRINDYVGADANLIVSYGGTLESLGYNDNIFGEELHVNETDGNYYNITIKDNTHKFIIMKSAEEKLEKPKYKGKNIETDIDITTDAATVPLDTHLTVQFVENDNIASALGTDNYEAFDIKLYSNNQEASITKLENGKFLVSIPVTEKLEGKNVTVYYINSNNEAEEYKTVIENGVASFETDHFSTYILAEKIVKADPEGDPSTSPTIIPDAGTQTIITILLVVATLMGIVFYKKYNKFDYIN